MQANPQKVVRLLKTARGQLDGILKMVEENRYCMDISQQLMATEALLNTVNREVLTAHLKSCVAEAETQAEREARIDELVAMLQKIMK
ncbi:MAG: metal-sensing transcriptional repressor [Oscillospiraceae bacterium]|nr:metal-sensing transcriptional repressor [Oscillospiraceae bacterium]